MLKIRLIETGKHKIEVVKLIRLFTQLGLKESKELMDNTPSVLVSNREDISIEQIKKNFEAIGAVIEEIIEEYNPPVGAAGIDDSATQPDTEPSSRIIKDYDKKSVTIQPTKPQLILGPAIIFALIAALFRSYISIRLGYFSFYIVFIVAVGVAYFLRKNNQQIDWNLGIAAASVTFLYFFSSIIIDWIILFILYDYIISVNILSIITSFFTSLNVFVIIAAFIAYFIASNKNIFKNLVKNQLSNENKSKTKMDKNFLSKRKEKKKF